MKNILLLLVSVFALAACNSDTPEVFRSSQGTHNDIMFVMDDELWEGAFGSLLRDRMSAEVDGLPQPEPLFNYVQVEYSAFGDLFERYKSLIFFRVIPDSTQFSITKNHWAAPQLVASLIAPTKLELARLFEEHKDEIIEAFQEHDNKILLNRVKKTARVNLPTQLKDLGIESMVLPEAFQVTVDHDSLVIMYSQNIRTNQYLFFHIRPIQDDALPGSDMIAVRDSILKYDFEGPSEGSYPGTEKLVPPTLKTATIDGNMAFELRGLWKTYNDFMGGPFLSYAIYDEERGVILTAESFMYGPSSKKHKIMMEMEVILKSIKLK